MSNLADKIAAHISLSTNNRVKKITITIKDRHVTLHGECNSFYVKQLAGLALKKIATDNEYSFTDDVEVFNLTHQ